MYNNLLFFNKNGKQLNVNLDGGVWKTVVNLPRFSVGTIENETIYVVEKLKYNGDIVFGRPTGNRCVGKFTDRDAFSTIKIDNPFNSKPKIKKTDKTKFILLDAVIGEDDGISIVDEFDNNCLRFDICANSDIEGNYKDNLTITFDDEIVAVIEFYCEIEGEDERFATLLNNFGEYISEREAFIFRNTDINETLPDYKIINEKRKQMLVDINNIKPVLPAYKGLISILEFFGYSDLRIKEYWKNVETGKNKLLEVKLGESLDKPVESLEYPYAKTANFGLYYDINIVTDREDENDLPITVDNFQFQHQEIIIKLFGLKKYIKDRNIGGVANIIDIVGEAVYFHKFENRYWIDSISMPKLDVFLEPDFKFRTTSFIEDLRFYDEIGTEFPDPNITVSEPIQFSGIYNKAFIGYFQPFNQLTPDFLDEPNIKIGCRLFLTDNVFDFLIRDCNASWKNIKKSWKEIGHRNYYELEWEVTHVSLDFVYKKRAKINDINKNHLVILPYIGDYNIKMTIYGYNGVISMHTKPNAVTVRMKESRFAHFFKYRDPYLKKWKNLSTSWKKLKGKWDDLHETDDFKFSGLGISYRSLMLINYDVNTDLPGLGIQPTKISHLRTSWKNCKGTSFKDYKPESERSARFTIVKTNSEIKIGENTVTTQGLNIHEFEKLADILSQNPNLQNFSYIARPMNITPDSCDCVSTEYGSSGNVLVGSKNGAIKEGKKVTWKDLKKIKKKLKWKDDIQPWINHNNIYYTNGVDEPINLTNIKFFENSNTIPTSTMVWFTVDNCMIAGKTKVLWKIEQDGVTLFEVESFWLCARFFKKGKVSITLTITDTNGNENSTRLENHLIIEEAHKYFFMKSKNR